VPDCDTTIADVYKQAGVCFDGSKALANDFMRKYQGYGTINYSTLGGSSNYHSLQVTVNRRFTRSVSLGLAYTYSKAMGTANTYSDFINPICSRCADYRPLSFDRTHLAVINYDWHLPGLSSGNAFLRGITNGWQITGITQFISGAPNDVTVAIPNINFSQRVGGSYTESTRGLFVGDIQSDRERTKYFNWDNVVLPTVAQALQAQGAFPRNRVRQPGINNTDLSLFKNFRLGGDSSRNLQLRLEAFNIFNHPAFSDMNRTLTFNIQSNLSDYLNNLRATSSNVQQIRGSTLSGNPVLGNGVAEVNGLTTTVAGNRVIQLAVKIFF
jgi:hypothetical protein